MFSHNSSDQRNIQISLNGIELVGGEVGQYRTFKHLTRAITRLGRHVLATSHQGGAHHARYQLRFGNAEAAHGHHRRGLRRLIGGHRVRTDDDRVPNRVFRVLVLETIDSDVETPWSAAESTGITNMNRSRAMALARTTASCWIVLFSRSECSGISSGSVD